MPDQLPGLVVRFVPASQSDEIGGLFSQVLYRLSENSESRRRGISTHLHDCCQDPHSHRGAGLGEAL